MMTSVQPPPLVDAYRQSAAEVCAALGTSSESGLTTAEARARLERVGRNELQHTPPVPTWRKALAQLQSPLSLLLLAATAISFLVWLIEAETAIPYEALTILAIVVLNAVLGYVQEARAEQAIADLQTMSAPLGSVIRDGERQTIPTAEVVPGDILVIEEGATIPADARLIVSASLQTSEAALTGESTPVAKDPAPLPMEAGIGDRTNMLFSGSTAAGGHGTAVVTAAGMQTEIGRIAGLLAQTEQEETPLQKQLDDTGRVLGVIVIAIAVVVGGTILAIERDFSVAVLTSVLLYTVSLAVSAVPEGPSAITTVVLSLGTQRMARRNVIIRRLSAVETLGSATVICTDKTGTLTKNEMTVRVLVTAGGRVDLTGIGYAPEGELLHAGRVLGPSPLRTEAERTLAAGLLDNNATLAQHDGTWAVAGDPTEGALTVAALKAGLRPEQLERRFDRIGEIPFSSERKLMSTLHHDAKRSERAVLFAKGAPDILLSRCAFERAGDGERPLTDERRAAILAAVDELAAEALRPLGIAERTLGPDVAGGDLDESLEEDLVWLGVAGMIDPPRPEAVQAVQVAHQAGVRVIMITGDHPVAAAAIAAELGIAARGARAVTGTTLEEMDEAALRDVAREASVYARVNPEHKLKIIRALKSDGAIVAMTGDGVNDAPALKAADIGVAMGVTGTDVSKDAADMILTDDNFASIVAAIEEGRSIYANIQKFLRYLLSTNLGEVLVLFFGVVLAGALGVVAEPGEAVVLPLLATMILWINLVTDSGPALALGLDPADPRLMRRAPRDPRGRVITRRMWQGIAGVGVVMAAGSLLLFNASMEGGLIADGGDLPYARTMLFQTVVLFSLINVFGARSDVQSAFHGLFNNRWLWLAVGISLLLQAAVLYLPVLQRAFGTVPLSAGDWAVSAGVASSVLWLREAVKLIRRSRGDP